VVDHIMRQVRRLERHVGSLRAARDGLRLELDGAVCQLEGQLAEAAATHEARAQALTAQVRRHAACPKCRMPYAGGLMTHVTYLYGARRCVTWRGSWRGRWRRRRRQLRRQRRRRRCTTRACGRSQHTCALLSRRNA
jgi:hypothetical protein